MRLINGKWQCVQCGAAVDIPSDKKPQIILKTSSGERMMRTLNVDGQEVHRCPASVAKPPAP
jgi:hypothetical protein